MGNTLVVAEKEFKDLLSDRIMLVVIGAFLLYILVDLSHIHSLLGSGFFDTDPNYNQDNPAANLAETMLNQITFMLSRYGAILGIAVGFLSIAGERHSGALNALVSKPLRRNSIIVGKTIGSLGFLICIFTLAAAFLTSGLMLLASDTIAPVISDYIARMPMAVFTALLYTMVFFFLAMFISLLIDSYAFALILSLLAWTVSGLMATYTFAGYIATFLGDEKGIGNLIVGLSPDGMIKNISYKALTNFNLDIDTCISNMVPEALKLAVIAAVLLVLSFVAFNRRDIV
jgi:ABC-type transport system involved in multi-copper enzyme maturation, permease component